MSKPVKAWMMRDYQDLLEGTENALVISVRGIPANKNNELRQALAEKDITVTVVRNNLARKAVEGSSLETLSPLLTGPTALAYGAESVVDVARELVKWAKDVELLELKGACLDGILFEGESGVEQLSKYPTREEAQANVVTLILSPARNLMGSVKGPGGRLMGVVKALEEKLEKGEAIAKVG